MDRDQLETFATIVEVQSFEKASIVLSISKGAVSQRIKALEGHLSCVLLFRDSPVRPTRRGEILLQHVNALRLLEESTLSKLLPCLEKKLVRIAIAVNADSLATWFSYEIQSLLHEHRIAIEVMTDDQEYTLNKLIRGDVIGCISTKPTSLSGFAVRPLGKMEYRCCASAEFFNMYFSNGVNVKNLINTPALLFDRKDTLHDDFLKSAFGFSIKSYPKHYLPSPDAILNGIRVGIGYGLIPLIQLASENITELVDLFPGKPYTQNLYWHHWEIEFPQSKIITEFILEASAKYLIR